MKKDAKIVLRCERKLLSDLKKAAKKQGVYMSDLARNALKHEIKIILRKGA